MIRQHWEETNFFQTSKLSGQVTNCREASYIRTWWCQWYVTREKNEEEEQSRTLETFSKVQVNVPNRRASQRWRQRCCWWWRKKMSRERRSVLIWCLAKTKTHPRIALLKQISTSLIIRFVWRCLVGEVPEASWRKTTFLLEDESGVRSSLNFYGSVQVEFWNWLWLIDFIIFGTFLWGASRSWGGLIRLEIWSHFYPSNIAHQESDRGWLEEL